MIVADRPAYRDKKAFLSRLLTVYGRKPTLQALADQDLECHALHLASSLAVRRFATFDAKLKNRSKPLREIEVEEP